MNRISRRIPAMLFAFVIAAQARAQLTYVTLDHPLARAGGTVPYGVDGNRVVGTFLDAAGTSHAFVYDGTTWTVLDHPSAATPRGTAGYGVADGLICGTYVDSAGRVHGFVFDGANWTTLDHPPIALGPVDTVARGIAPDGTVVGYFIESLVARGFTYQGGTFSDVSVPGAIGVFPEDTDAGRIVGTFDDLLGTHGMLVEGGTLTVLDHPLGLVFGTFVTGIDGPNIVGNYLDPNDGSAHGFLYDGTAYTPLDIPGAADTTVHGIDGDQVVGVYVDRSGTSHGFLATIPEPSHAACATISLALAGRRRRRRATAI